AESFRKKSLQLSISGSTADRSRLSCSTSVLPPLVFTRNSAPFARSYSLPSTRHLALRPSVVSSCQSNRRLSLEDAEPSTLRTQGGPETLFGSAESEVVTIQLKPDPLGLFSAERS